MPKAADQSFRKNEKQLVVTPRATHWLAMHIATISQRLCHRRMEKGEIAALLSLSSLRSGRPRFSRDRK
jgi:hypothetical protein